MGHKIWIYTVKAGLLVVIMDVVLIAYIHCKLRAFILSKIATQRYDIIPDGTIATIWIFIKNWDWRVLIGNYTPSRKWVQTHFLHPTSEMKKFSAGFDNETMLPRFMEKETIIFYINPWFSKKGIIWTYSKKIAIL